MPFIDQTRRQLRVPPKYVPYMEKFRLYQLFHEFARELIIKKPEDHVKFLYDSLIRASEKVSARYIVIYGPPFLNKNEIVEELSRRLGGLYIIPVEEIERKMKEVEYEHKQAKKVFAKLIKKWINDHYNDGINGWILLDYPRTREEAVILQRVGVLPTHVFQLVPAFVAPYVSMEREDIPYEWKEYRRNLIGLRQAFHSRWHEVSMNQRELKDILGILCALVRNNKHCGGPMVPRVCLIGPPGSGCKSVAKIVAEKLGLEYVHFPLLLKMELLDPQSKYHELTINPIELSKKSRLHSEILFKKLLEKKCVDYGWILTGYPEILLDMKRLDKMATPPNRVIFFNCPDSISIHRLKNRKMNVYTGSVTNVALEPLYEKDHKLSTHPEDLSANVDKRLKIYRQNENSLKDYCGETAYYINSDITLPELVEAVLSIIINSPPDVPPRNPYEPHANVHMEYPRSTANNVEDNVDKCDSDYIYRPEPQIDDYCAEHKLQQQLAKQSYKANIQNITYL